MFDRDDEDMIAYLEEQGALSWDGMDEEGEPLFKFNLEILREVMPPLYDEIMKDIDEDLMILYENGYVELEYDENLNALFRISDKGVEWAENMGIKDFPFPN
jgi:hypothetical protein